MVAASGKIYPVPDPVKFSLCWLDSEINATDDNRKTEARLRSIFDQLKTFSDVDQCEKFIESYSEKYPINLIVSGKLGRAIVPKIHQLQQISSIYVYCLDKEINEEWAYVFEKV